jgi:cold shock CspA family protein
MDAAELARVPVAQRPSPSVYVHVRDIEDENVHELPRGAKVEYDLTMAEKGPRALRVAIID